MNINHLGDAFDFWKGRFIKELGNKLYNIKVLPMFTDKEAPFPWNEDCLRLYARLIGVNVRDILRQNEFNSETRRDYFQDLDDNSDLFVDPDVGIKTPSKDDNKHIRLSEIIKLLPKDTKRIVLIYQHSARTGNRIDERLREIIGELNNNIIGKSNNNICAFAYLAGSVSMVFFARNRKRLEKMYQVLHPMTLSLPKTRVLPIIP
jgi:hypothetical protein